MKKKKTTVGLTKSDLVDLGSPYLHQHFIMLLERLGKGDQLVRSRIRNQTVFDMLHVLELISDQQHSAGEHLLEIAVKSGFFLNPTSYEDQIQKNRSPSSTSNFALRSLKISKITRLLDRELGEQSNYVFDVVVLNRQVKTIDQLEAVKKGLDLVLLSLGLAHQNVQSSALVLQAVRQSA
tara:strand:- start:1255 stop:1794 length:540 start_codon:yes stop_codon:yes gene_type:complete